MADENDFEAIAARLDRTLAGLRATAEPAVWERAQEAIRLVTELYGAGLARVVETLLEWDRNDETGTGVGSHLLDGLAEDEVVGGLLILHDLHPGDLPRRIEAALEEVRPYLNSHGGDVEVLDVDGASQTVRLRLLGSCDGCPSSSVTLRDAVDRAVMKAAPDVARIEVEGDEPAAPPTPLTLGAKPSLQPATAGARTGR